MELFRIHHLYKILLLSAGLLLWRNGIANDDGGIVARAILDGSLNQLKVDSSRTVEDSAFFNHGSSGYLDTAYKVNNIVTLKINEASGWFIKTAFTVTVQLRIIYSNGTSQDSVTRDFTINYDSANAYQSRSSFVFNGGRRVTVKVLSITSNASTWDVGKVLMIENQLTARPKFLFSCTSTVTNITVQPPGAPQPDELLVTWTTVRGADQYDLEWTYIDSSALGRYDLVNNIEGLFLHNATRISTTATSYSIPLMYDNSGALYIRVRPVRQGPRKSVITAIWSTEAGSPIMGSFGFRGHERLLNWQSNISFAEEGKRKVVVQYFDGSLRGRQTVTKDNTTQNTIVAETYYDYQGRPSIQVLPAPSLNNIVQYTAGFNVSINGAEYSRSQYDTLISPDQYCSIHADSMSSLSGAAQYYSPNNPQKNDGLNQFIPDANNFPFTETEYLPDNTGRISRQGGVGKDHQLGSGHETKYYYGTPDQQELDALFGTEVGDRSHYFKNMVRDANGQYSVSYVDMQGRTIATALAGMSPSGMQPLPSNTGSTITETLTDSNSVIFDGLDMISQKSILVPVADNYTFNYTLDPSSLSDTSCTQQPVCYTCRYDLQITITDNCNNQSLPGQKAFDTVIRNFLLPNLSAGCSQPATPLQLNFTLGLSEGSYMITKKLTVNKDAYYYYRDSVYLPGNTCVSLEQYINEQRSIIAMSSPQCVTTCSACRDSVGTIDHFRNEFMLKSGLSPADTAAFRNDIATAYRNALSACSSLCGDSLTVGADIRSIMLQDMTPPYGQYADTTIGINGDQYSIFFERPSADEDVTNPPVYRFNNLVYRDMNGNTDSVYNLGSDMMVLPNTLSMSEFTQNFRSSWAEALLPYHPEYCKLQALEANRPAIWWNSQMEGVDNFRDALQRGYLNPSGNSSYPFPGNSAYADPLASGNSSWRSFIEDKLSNYLPAAGGNPTLSMWGMACMMVKCEANDINCINFYASSANWFDTTAMCEGDLDMAWKNFRQLYLNVKQEIINRITTSPAGCTPLNPAYTQVPTAAALFAAGHRPAFTEDTRNTAEQNGLEYLLNSAGNTSAANQAIANAEQEMNRFYQQNSEAYVQQWAQQLAPCQYNADHLRDTILPRLVALCRMACDSDHPFGASTLPPGITYTPAGTSYIFRSFRDIINAYNEAHGIDNTLQCNAELITTPQPYGSQSAYFNKPVYSKPSDCECQLINDFYNTYLLSGQGDYSFSAWLKRTQQVTISDEALNQLRALCNAPAGSSCTYLSNPILLPPSMQCNTGTVCATCTIVDSLYGDYTALYPDKVPQLADEEDSTQTRINQLFQNYMNNRLGFSLQAWQYIQFMDTCAHHQGVIYDSLKCQDKPIGNLYLTSQSASFSDVQPVSTGGYIMAGSIQSAGNTTDASLVRIDHTGNILWSKRVGGNGNDQLQRIKPTADGGFIGIGTTYSGLFAQGEIMVLKLDAAGNTRWTKTLGFNTTYGERGYDIVQTSDGGYAALGIYNQHTGTGEFLLSRLDTAGSIAWTHKFGTSRIHYSDCGDNEPDSVSYDADATYSLLELDDTLFVAGAAYDINMGDRYHGVVYRIGKDSGDLIGAWHYADNSNLATSTRFNDIQATSDGFIVGATTANRLGTDDQHVAVVRLTASGEVVSYRQFNRPAGSTRINSSGILAADDGSYLVGQTGNNSPHIYWQRISTDGTQLWASETGLPGTQQIGRLVANSPTTFVVAGSNNGQAMMLSLQKDAPTNCYDNTVNPGSTSPVFSRINWALYVSQILYPYQTDTSFTMASVSITDSSLLCYNNGSCYMVYEGPRLCGKSAPVFPAVAVDSSGSCADSTFFAVSKATELYNHYKDSLTGAFEQRYNSVCLEAYRYESFTVTHARREYHYTLYYYDQADNLVKTVPPAGVQPNDDPAWLSQVRTARKNKTVQVPAHTLVTNYRYNTLNQVVAQQTPDGGLSHFWYDRLGRLCVSQNAQQAQGDQYSYTKYDSIGRIVQVGQVTSVTAINETISRNQASLQLWLAAAESTAEQITQTTYDYAYDPLEPVLSARNLRNRVSWTALYNTAVDLDTNGIATATYYSYDILGNVDTLVQDYKLGVMADNGNRFKKLVYDYDLVSGKVNQVAYQAGQPDAFYHRYLYDAENRITHVLTSADSINWENDAFYAYYRHGPLARTVLGEQQVQAINYAYNLQGWLKAINPAVHQGAGYTLQADGSSGSIVGVPAYDLVLNYFNGDYSPISGAAAPDAGVGGTLGGEYRPLYNGNISSMAANIRKLEQPLLYNYEYDQLNRLISMDAWHRTGSNWNNIVKLPDFQERISYDPNGNILGYKRQGNNSFAGSPLGMDSLSYHYKAGTNQLDHVRDSVPSGNYTVDIDGQPVSNYRYDAIGNMISDSAENISKIEWTVYGKIRSIHKKDGALIEYTYDAAGNRISKRVASDTGTVTTWYVRDAQGNTLSVYTAGQNSTYGGDLTQTELYLYGSSRVGMLKCSANVKELAPVADTTMPLLGTGIGISFERGNKLFELSNHLGNVLVTVSDKKLGLSIDDSTVDHFEPVVVSAQDYYPFGMGMVGRSYNEGGYRYGFNGKENDNEVKGEGNQQDYGMRIYDPRVGRFLSVDPVIKEYPELTPYQFASNTPIWAIDLDGLEGLVATGVNGHGMIINAQDAAKINKTISTWVSNNHQQGMRNVRIAEQAKQQAIKQGRLDGDGINWYTKFMVYLGPWWNATATYSDANDGAVLLSGKNLDGSSATVGDYIAASLGSFIPFVSGGVLKKAGGALIEGTIGVFKNGEEVRELAYKIGKYGHKGTKEYNSIVGAVKRGGNIVANSKDEALKFLKEAMPGISDETGKTASKFGYRIDNVVIEGATDGLKQGHQGLHINYYDKENKVKGTILVEEAKPKN